MEEITSKTKLKFNMCAYRRLNIEHEFDEHLRKQNYLSNLHFYKHQEQLLNRKINHLRKSLANIEPYNTDDINDEESLTEPNCFTRIQNHFRLLNFSSDTEKRLLCQAPSSNKSSKQTSNQLPNISQKRNSNECIRRVSCSPSRPSKKYSCRSATNHRCSNSDFVEQKTFQSYLNQQIFDEQKKQIKNDQRKNFLLKEFDELKHTIDDPNSTISVLAALSRAIIVLDSGTE